MPQTETLQAALHHMHRMHSTRTHIFTDGSSTPQSSSSGLHIPSTGKTFSYRLERPTSSTSAELQALKEAMRYILRHQPNKWAIFTDYKAALQCLISSGRPTAYDIAAQDVSYLHHLACIAGHIVAFQWVPGHCGITGNQRADEAANKRHTYRTTRNIF